MNVLKIVHPRLSCPLVTTGSGVCAVASPINPLFSVKGGKSMECGDRGRDRKVTAKVGWGEGGEGVRGTGPGFLHINLYSWYNYIIGSSKKSPCAAKFVPSSVADPYPDPNVFGPPGSGSGSFYREGKNLNSYCFVTFLWSFLFENWCKI
jgi:hypothetical protein